MKDSYSTQTSKSGYSNRQSQLTEGLGETFLRHIKESKRWQEDLISAIHQDDSSFMDRGLSVSTTERDIRLQKKLIDKLYFPQISDRENRIVDAYEKTFQWIYKDPESEETPWPSFTKWLKDGSGLYWITSKAGSGKSTLMKYIYKDRRTFKI